jgi:hypothetical protein
MPRLLFLLVDQAGTQGANYADGQKFRQLFVVGHRGDLRNAFYGRPDRRDEGAGDS